MQRFRSKNPFEVEAIELDFGLDFDLDCLDGTSRKVQPGDFLVTFPWREQKVIDRAEFLANYDPIKRVDESV
jgi:hypothetical protein